MPDAVLDPPSVQPQLNEKPAEYYIEQGKQGGLKSGLVRRERAKLVSQFESLRPFLQPLLKPDVLVPLIPQNSDHTRLIQKLQSHIDRIDTQLETCDKAADWRDLANARFKLFEQWAHLSGIPKPMAPRDSRTPSRRMTIQLPDPVPVTPPPSPK